MNSGFPDLSTIAYILLTIIAAGLALAAALFLYVIWRIRRINLPVGANFVTARSKAIRPMPDWG